MASRYSNAFELARERERERERSISRRVLRLPIPYGLRVIMSEARLY
jgi:predicted Ser/Thr protein kinase